MLIDSIRLLILVVIAFGIVKTFSGLLWALASGDNWKADINIPKKKIKATFILLIICLEVIYGYRFFPVKERISVLQFSSVIGIPIGILGLVFYNWVFKQKEKGRSITRWFNDSEGKILKVTFKDCINNAAGFFAIFCGGYILYLDFFKILAKFAFKAG